MKKNITVKVFAFLALFWIIASVIWTWIMVFFGNNITPETEKVLTQKDIEKIISEWNIKITNSWSTIKTWETK
jgi:predicted adenine nucleotide alpha hydrolase (AANH) superfamily ATPase